MSLSTLPNDRITLILGGPRSGTTWLAKIFDSHPDVLYRHEPDTVLRDPALQRNFALDDLGAYIAPARAYLHRLFAVSTLKSAGSLPTFDKRYHGTLAHRSRQFVVFVMRVAAKLNIAPKLLQSIAIPDCLPDAATRNLHLVMKSVSSLGRARLFAEALPGCKIVFIVRDPCGQIASTERGFSLGKLERPVPIDEIIGTVQAARYGLTEERLFAMPRLEQLAWHWSVLNEKTLDDLEGLPNATIIRYLDLCLEPIERSKALFGFCGLDWNPQTEDFVKASSTSNAPDRYFQVYKNTNESLNKWRNQLTADDQATIISVVRQTKMWALCKEYDS